MKNITRMLGVTLLEIMLVLAIAAMIIVMSIRYYQNATIAQQTNGVMQTLLAITAAADNLAAGTGTYSNVTTSAIKNIVGSVNIKTPWSSTNPFTLTPGSTSYTVSLSTLPTAVCTSLLGKLASGKSGSHFTAAACTGSGNATTLTYTYNANAT